MSTRGNIAIQLNPSGLTFKTIYNHFDSYPDTLGALLLDKYNTAYLANELIDQGDCSYPEKSYKSKGESWDVVQPMICGDLSSVHDNEFSYVWMYGKGWYVSSDGDEWNELK
jgi:hypothetical protein